MSQHEASIAQSKVRQASTKPANAATLDRPDLEQELAQLDAALLSFNADFHAKHGAYPTEGDRRTAAHARRHELRVLLAPPPAAGQCLHFIERKRRFCSSMAFAGSERCSVHGSAHSNVEESGVATVAASGIASRAGDRKTNIARTPKRMANPLSKQYLQPTAAPDWASVYAERSRPMLVDIGCARGRWLKQLAGEPSGLSWNHCGLEIYPPLVVAANEAIEDGCANLHFVACNAMVSMESLGFEAEGSVACICVQFPDPWDGRKHGKRRLLNTTRFARVLARVLRPGGQLYISSDAEELASSMRKAVEASGCFELGSAPAFAAALPGAELVGSIGADGWLTGANPFGVPTERDRVCEIRWRPVWRMLFRRTAGAVPDDDGDELEAAGSRWLVGAGLCVLGASLAALSLRRT